MEYNYLDVAKMIDHALLHPTLTVAELEAGIELCKAYDVASVCIQPYYLKRCAEQLAGTTVLPSTVIGFPLGVVTTATKVSEAEQAISSGCQELDMVANISKVLSHDWDYVQKDIAAVIDVAHDAGRQVKVIFENCYLQDEHKIKLCEICTELKADWVKTSTGFGTGGATIEDLQLMLDHVDDGIQVKAAGGVRDLETLVKIRQMGVTRCGTSRTGQILDPARETFGMEPIDSSKENEVGY